MAAGGSALWRAGEAIAQAERLARLAGEKRKEAADFRKAAASEAGLAGVLAPLRGRGWVVLEDRKWPGSRRANIDFLLVGPAGVFVLDAKHWDDVRIENGTLYRGESAEDAQIEKLHSLLDALHAAVEHTGLTPAGLSAALVFTGRSFTAQVGATWILGESAIVSWLLRQPARLSAHDVAELAAVLDQVCPEIDSPRPAPIVEIEITAGADLLPGLEDLAEAMMAAELSGAIEDWMVFLHPDQNRLIRSQWNGPARLRGPAGSGKTTVALHRAAYLALRSSHPVLFVTFVRTLPKVMRNLAHRINARAASRIEFSGLHAKAMDILARAGRTRRVDRGQMDGAFGDAWFRSGVRPALAELDPNPQYWRQEIDYVIKGRGITGFDRYAELRRVGRTTRLQRHDRERVWTLFEAYEAALARRRTVDFTDILTLAHQAVLDDPGLVEYSGVVVDEVQDLTMVGLQLLDALSGDGPNRLLIVGDGQQAVYPGGFTLAEAGVSVVGRATVLDRNYRNTVQILRAAERVIADADHFDIEGAAEAVVTGRAFREGAEPVRVHALSTAELDAEMIAHIRHLQSNLFVAFADMAVLVTHRRDAESVTARLRTQGLPTISLEHYEGTSVPAIKVGTIKRAKGLEFKAVLLPRADLGNLVRHAGEGEESFAERRALAQREMYVAMTRARDHLWIGELKRQRDPRPGEESSA